MEFQINSKEPIYTQIINYMKKQIIKGNLKGGDRILSVRECASELKVNPNTIQRAYTELEDIGLIYTQRGIGKFVVDDTQRIKELQIEMLKDVVDNFIKESKELGVNKDDIIEILNERYN
ncbi:MAG: GntR family transcriptional regulator [Clostridium sp.]|uniref:GntR family transcriptional regulator n=1 Tax=Clostridium sp. TaxID=1506 RepID=UPI0025C6E8D5|nr:GntR family transcriptional regulator [Clostridium sp.]MCF0149449.1 GntR family transcriptional regulator [Clostridium sp.]